MARKRQIDPGIWTSEQFINLEDPWAKLLFIGMFSNCDDEGRMKASPVHLKAVVFPADSHTTDQILEWRNMVEEQRLCQIYTVNGTEYLSLPSWHRHQFITKRYSSLFPPPPDHEPVIAINLSQTERQFIYQRDEYTCQYCGIHMEINSRVLSIDHINPIQMGGTQDYPNLVTACKSCNVKKASRTPQQAGMTLIGNGTTYVIPTSNQGVSTIPSTLTPQQHGTGTGTGTGTEEMNVDKDKGFSTLFYGNETDMRRDVVLEGGEVLSVLVVWKKTLGELRSFMTPSNHATWLTGTMGIGVKDTHFIVGVQGQVKYEQLMSRIKPRIEKALSNVTGRLYSLQARALGKDPVDLYVSETIEAVTQEYSVSKAELLRGKRTAEIVSARREIAQRLDAATTLSITEIGQRLGVQCARRGWGAFDFGKGVDVDNVD